MAKNNIDVKIIVDTREQDTSYVKGLVDVRVGKDGIKFKEVEVKCVKPIGSEKSTGDITIEYRIKDSDGEWIKTNLSIELKKASDAFTSLYTKANRERLFKEIDRAKVDNLDFYFIITDDLTNISNIIKKIPKFRNTNVNISYFDYYLKLDEKLRDNGFNAPIISGKDLSWCIKRVIKHHINKNKIQHIKKESKK